MSLYVDSSALLKRYVDEPESDACAELLASDPRWITARHTYVQVLRNLARVVPEARYSQSRDQFLDDWRHIDVAELDEVTCTRAAELAVTLGGGGAFM